MIPCCALRLVGRREKQRSCYVSLLNDWDSFVHYLAADNSISICNENEVLHDIACNRHLSLIKNVLVKELARQLNPVENIAIY